MDPTGQNEPCKSRLHQGDTNNDGVLANADLLRSFQSANTQESNLNTCPARPEPVP